MSNLPKAYFSKTNLTAIIGNSIKGYLVCNCIRVPLYQKRIQTRECLGGGWLGETKIVDVVIDNNFVILDKNNQPIGVLLNPYQNGIKSDIHPITSNIFDSEIKNFLTKLTQDVQQQENKFI